MLETVHYQTMKIGVNGVLQEGVYIIANLSKSGIPLPIRLTAVLKSLLFSTIICSVSETFYSWEETLSLVMSYLIYQHYAKTRRLVKDNLSFLNNRDSIFEGRSDCSRLFIICVKIVNISVKTLAFAVEISVTHCASNTFVMFGDENKNSDLHVPLVQRAHLVDSLLLTLKKALHTDSCGVSDVSGESECQIILADITEILSCLTNALVASTQHKFFMVILEILQQLSLVSRSEAVVCGGQASCVGHLRVMEAHLLQVALSRIQVSAATSSHTLTHQGFYSLPNRYIITKESDKISGSVSMHNMKVLSPTGSNSQEDSDSGLGSVLSSFPALNVSKSVHNLGDQLSGRSNSRGEDKILAHSELIDRFKVILQKSTDFLLVIPAWSSVESMASTVLQECSVGASQDGFSLYLLELLLGAVSAVTQRRSNSERSGWERVVWSCQDILRLHLTHLMALVTAPRTSTHTRTAATTALVNHPRALHVLAYAAKANAQLMHKVGIFVHELRHHHQERLEATDIKNCDTLLLLLEDCQVHTLPPPEINGALKEWSVVTEEKRIWQEETSKIASLIVDRCNKQDKRLLTKNNGKFESVVAECSRLTRTVVDRQNVERKVVLGGIKHSQCRHVHLTHRWHRLIDTLTHERATWHLPEAYPKSWQLDQTEGPMRVRKRLTRGRLHINPKHLRAQYANKLDIESAASPLEAVLAGCESESAMAVMIERLNVSERIVHMSSAAVVSPGMEQRGEILISRTAIYFLGEQLTIDMNQGHNNNGEVISVTWGLESVREVRVRRYQLRDCALELFLTTGHSVLLAFSDAQHRNQVLETLKSLELPNLCNKTTLLEVTMHWREGQMSNYEYLTQLNKLAGRSFNDLMQYPVFPFILSNYTADILSLNDPTVYRNLKKPIAVQQKHKEQHYINNYEM
ncbi:unnamed protein product, partial [Meganyctiphanes norvegica]